MNIFVKLFKIWASGFGDVVYFNFSIFSSGGHFTQQTKMDWAIFIEEHFCEFGFVVYVPVNSYGHVENQKLLHDIILMAHQCM